MRRFLISTTDELWEYLKQRASKRGQTLSGLVRDTLREWAEADGKDIKKWDGEKHILG